MPGEIFPPLSPPALTDKILSCDFLSHVNDHIESVATFTALVNFFFFFLNFAKEAGLGEFFFSAKIFGCTYGIHVQILDP